MRPKWALCTTRDTAVQQAPAITFGHASRSARRALPRRLGGLCAGRADGRCQVQQVPHSPTTQLVFFAVNEPPCLVRTRSHRVATSNNIVEMAISRKKLRKSGSANYYGKFDQTKVRFPVTGSPERSAAGQGGAAMLLVGLFPTILELSRVSQIGWNGFN